MPLKCHKHALCMNYLAGINRGSMSIHLAHMSSQAWAIWPKAMYIDDKNDANDNVAQLHKLSLQIDQINQKPKSDIVYQNTAHTSQFNHQNQKEALQIKIVQTNVM